MRLNTITMKTALVLLLTLAALGTRAQIIIPYDTVTGKVSFTETTEVDSMSRHELYERALQWLRLYCKHDEAGIMAQDEATGRISGKYLFKEEENTLTGSILITVTEGACTMRMTAFRYRYYNTAISYWRQGPWEDFLKLRGHRREKTAFIHACADDIRLQMDSFATYVQNDFMIPEAPMHHPTTVLVRFPDSIEHRFEILEENQRTLFATSKTAGVTIRKGAAMAGAGIILEVGGILLAAFTPAREPNGKYGNLPGVSVGQVFGGVIGITGFGLNLGGLFTIASGAKKLKVLRSL